MGTIVGFSSAAAKGEGCGRFASANKFGYHLKPLGKQIECLRKFFTHLKKPEVVDSIELPRGAEGWFAIPNIWKGNFPLDTYGHLVEQMLGWIKKERNGNFYNYRHNQLNPSHLRQSANTATKWQRISVDQGHPDILVIAGQFGCAYCHDSVQRALEIMLDQKQFGPGLFATGIMLLTHPDRLCCCDDLEIDCAGDEFDDPCADRRFDHTPYLAFVDGRVVLDTCPSNQVTNCAGSVSVFLPDGF